MIKLNHIASQVFMTCFALLIMLAGCHKEEKFSTEKWDTGDGLDFPLRNQIVGDLLHNHRLKGLKYPQVVHLLKYPGYRDSVTFYYEILNTYTNLHKHNHIKKLIFYIGKDSVVNKVELYDNKTQPKSTYF
jgi:hypothetical protein